MDDLTHSFYADYADQLRTRPEASRSAMMAFAERFFRPGDVVLDVGAGSGRDVAALRALGIAAYGIEPHAPMRALALATHPALADCIREGSLPGRQRPFQDLHPAGFDGVVCSAVLMHIAQQDLDEALGALAAMLKADLEPGVGTALVSPIQSPPAPGAGVNTPSRRALLLSVPEMSADLLQQHRDPDGRLFFNHSPGHITALLQRHGMTPVAHEVSDAVRASAGTRWHSLAFVQAPATQ